MFIFDDDEDEYRKIVSVEWANRKGYQVVTQLVGSEADVEQNQGYLINSELPPLVAAGKNPEYKMIMSPAEAAALTAAQQPQPRRAGDRGGDDVALAVQRTSAENLPLGAGGASWQGEWLAVSAAAAEADNWLSRRPCRGWNRRSRRSNSIDY